MREILGGALIFGLIAFALTGQDRQAAEPDNVESLKHEKLIAAEKWLKASGAEYNAGTGTLQELLNSQTEWKNSRLDVAKTTAERVQALRDYLQITQTLHAQIAALHQQEARGGESVKLEQSRYQMLTAKILLREEEAKP